jgi:hypothetical protein
MRKMIAFATSVMITAHAAAQDGCVRSEPSPAFPQAAPGIHKFTVKSTTEAVETLRLPSGEVLRLEHGGCEYYVLVLEFSAVAKQNAYASGAQLLDSLRPQQPDANFDLALAAKTLRVMAARNAPLGEESAVAGDGEDFLQANLKLEQAKGKLRLTLFRGPL